MVLNQFVIEFYEYTKLFPKILHTN